MSFLDIVLCRCQRTNRIVHPTEPNPEAINLPSSPAENNAVVAEEPQAAEISAHVVDSPVAVDEDVTMESDVDHKDANHVAETSPESTNLNEEKIEQSMEVEPKTETINVLENGTDSFEEPPKEDESNQSENHDPVHKTLQTAAEIIKKLSEDAGTITPESEADVDRIVAELAMNKLEEGNIKPEETDIDSHVVEEVKKLNGALLGFIDSETEVVSQEPVPEVVKEEPKETNRKSVKKSAAGADSRRKSKEAKVIKVRAHEVRELPKKNPVIENTQIPKKKGVQVKFKDDPKRRPSNTSKTSKKDDQKKKVAESEESQGEVVLLSPSEVEDTGSAAPGTDARASTADVGQEEQHNVRVPEKALHEEANGTTAETNQ